MRNMIELRKHEHKNFTETQAGILERHHFYPGAGIYIPGRFTHGCIFGET
jgi:hypothetical protein